MTGTPLPYLRPVPKPDRSSPVQRELAAMHTLAQLFEDLSPEARARVLQWAANAFQNAPSPEVERTSAHAVVQGRKADDLSDLFDGPLSGSMGSGVRSPMVPVGELPDDLFPPAAGEPWAAPDGRAQAVTSMINGFVEEFRKLAAAWKTDASSKTSDLP